MPAPSPRLENFLRLLGDRGMLRGVDRRLRIELALRELGEPSDPRALHDLLVPLVARNREEQARFRELFDDFFSVGPTTARRSSTGIAIPGPTAPGGRAKPRRLPLAGVALAALVAIALIWRGPLRDFFRREPQIVPADTASPPPSREQRGSRPPGSIPQVRIDTLKDADSGLPAEPVAQSAAGVPGSIVGASFGTAAIIGFPMLLAAFGARRRRALAYAADDARKHTPPLVYTPKPPKPPLFMSAEFFDAVRVAIRRQRMDGNRISVERTVEATIAAGGLPTLRYEPASRPPEYLILIERASVGDHQALLFDAMAQRMRQEGMLYVERYFYERDPRLCRSERGGPTTIDELQRRFHEHRLVIFGDGDGMFDALSNAELAAWTSVFAAWNERAILTAKPIASWGARERALSELFAMLPATPQGLREIVESFERGAAPDLRSWREGEVDRRWTRRGQSDIPTLRASLDPRVWRWVCACAVYPNLHWALTLYLATLPEFGGGELLREEHLLHLVTLPWFRDGFMPPEVRNELVDALDESTERAIRRTLARMLELDPPDATTAAGRWHEAQMFVQAVLANPDDREVRAALEARVRTLPRALLLRDPAAARRLREVHHRRFDRLPRAARTILYRDGISLFDSRPWTRRTAGAATVLAVAVLPSFLWLQREAPPATVAAFATPLSLRLPLDSSAALEARPRDANGRTLATPVTWAAADSAVAVVTVDSGRARVRGRRIGTTALLVRAGGGEARIPVDVVGAESAGAPVVITMPAKKIAVGETRQMPTVRMLMLSCDQAVATEMDDGSVRGQGVGTTRIVSILGGNANVELRELRVEANATDTLAVLTAPISFRQGSPVLTSAALKTLATKVEWMRARPNTRLYVKVRETDESTIRPPTTIARRAEIAGYFAKAGIASDRVVVSSSTLSYEGNDRFCAARVPSFATFAQSTPPLVAINTVGTGSRIPNAAIRPPRPVLTAVRPTGRVADSARNPTSVQPQPNPRQDQSPNQAPLPNAPSNAGVIGYGTGAQRGSAGDAPEPPPTKQARAELRDERMLKLAPADSTGVVGPLPEGTYAFAAPNALIATVEKNDETNLPASVHRTGSADFEIHNVNGVRYVAAFVDLKVALALRGGYLDSLGQLGLSPTATGSATCPVEIPLSSLRAPKYVTSTRTLQVTIQRRTKDEPYVPRSVTACPSGVQAK